MNFYHLAKDHNLESVTYSENVDWETIKCPTYEGHQRPGNRIGNLEIILKGPIDKEFFWTILSELIVTETFITLLRKNGLTGFKTKPAIISNRQSDTEFFKFIVTGEALARNIYLHYKCPDCGVEYYKAQDQPSDEKFLSYNKLIIDPKTWDGRDFFRVQGAGRSILISERVQELIYTHKLRGSIVTKAENFDEVTYQSFL